MNYVTDVVDYVLGLLGPRRPRPAPHALLPHRARPHAAKRDRSDTEVVTLQPDESSEEDDTAPALKRRRRPSPPPFPRLNMSRADNTDYRNDSTSKVRYVPIQVEDGHPSTSTPIDTSGRQVTRLKTYPASKRIGATEIRRLDPALKRVSTPVRKVVHTIIDDDDAEVSWIEPKSHSYGQNSRSSPELYVRLDDEEEEEVEEVQDENDIVYVRRVEPSVYTKKNQFFVSRNNNKDTERVSSPRQYYKIHGKFPPRRPVSPRMQNKFKAPAGVTKSYRQKNFTEIPKWLYPLKTSGNNRFPMKSRFSLLNGNAKTAIEEAFNLEEKLKYQALIQKSTGKWKPTQTQKEFETIDLDDDSVAKANKSSRKERYQDKEYDPITIASLTSSDSEVEIVGSSEASTSSSVRISPVNTFRDKLKEYPVTSCDFLDNLDKRHLIKRNKMQQELQDKKKASDILGEQNRRHNLELLERSFQTDLTITQSLLEESSSAVELPKLTAEQEKLVNRALGAGPSGQLLIEKFNLRIHRRDLQTLAGLNWLNDEVINFYMNLLMQRSEERNDLPKVYAANTFFYPKLMQSGQAGLRRWTRKVDIFAHDLIVIPVHLGVHWCLCLVEMDMKRIAYLDSMGGRNPQCLDAVLQYLCDEHKDKKGKQFDDSGWKKECLKDIPQQMNGSDCGMFACTFAEFSCRRAPYTFTQSDMPYLRRKLAYEILQGQLML